MVKKFLFTIVFISIATMINIAGYLYILQLKPAQAQAPAIHFIRSGAIGLNNGSDWNNAFDGIPVTLIRGDTYYIAGGKYDTSNYIFDDAENGTQTITIKKAAADGIADITPGWNASYASDIVTIYNSTDTIYQRALNFTKGYYVFDGVTGSGNNGHGILVTREPTLTPDSTLGRLYLVYLQANVSNVVFKHIAFDGYTLQESIDANLTEQAMLIKSVSGNSNIIFQYCEFRDFASGITISGDDSDGWLIENSYFEWAWGGGPHHFHGVIMDLIKGDNHIIRYNYFDGTNFSPTSITGEINAHGVISFGGSYLPENGGNVDNIEIYGNIFYSGTTSIWIGTASTICSVGMNNWKVYNNTIIGQTSKIDASQRTSCPGYTLHEGTWPASRWLVKNNLFYGGHGDPTEDGITYDYNYYNNMQVGAIPLNATNSLVSTETVGMLFKNYATGDFSLNNLSQAVNAGTDLGAPYNKDFIGTLRPQGSAWDIGAYEYIQAPPTLKADFNSDQKVNNLDFTSFKNAFKSLFNSIFDLNSDSTIDVKDLGVLMNNWLP